MIQRKKKQIVYNTEGDNYLRPDFNIKSIKAPPTPLTPLEPIQPNEPGPIKPTSIVQRTSETNQRPGGIDPYYRSRDTTKIKNNLRQYKEQVKQIKDQVALIHFIDLWIVHQNINRLRQYKEQVN